MPRIPSQKYKVLFLYSSINNKFLKHKPSLQTMSKAIKTHLYLLITSPFVGLQRLNCLKKYKRMTYFHLKSMSLLLLLRTPIEGVSVKGPFYEMVLLLK